MQKLLDKINLISLFPNLTTRQKMILTIFPIIAVFLFSSYVAYNAILEDLQNRIIRNNMQTLEIVKNEIEVRIDKFENEVINLLIDKTLQSYVDYTGPSDIESILKRNCYSNFFHNTPKVSYMSRNMCVIKNLDNYLYIDSNERVPSEFVSRFVANILNKNSDIYSRKYINPDKEFLNSFGILHFVHPAPKLTGYKTDAFIVINLAQSFLANILSQFYYKDSTLYVIDYNGNLIYSIPNKPITGSNLDAINSKNGYYVLDTSSGDILTSYMVIDRLGWIIFIQIPLNVIFKQVNIHKQIFLLYNSIAIFFSLILFYFTTSTITKRIAEISKVMEKVKNGEMSSRFQVRYKDEISVIGSRLNDMIESIQFLRFDISRKEMRQREAELIALQSQINPHFLYNTLETVRMIAINNDDVITSDIIHNLAKLFRYTIGKGGVNDIVYIKNEIEHVKIYLNIQKVRFDESIEVEMDIDEKIMNYKTIKLILQPVVENIFIHGFSGDFCSLRRKGIIIITGKNEDSQIKFTIEDNGKGLEKSKLMEIQNILSRSPYELRNSRTIGIINVNERIKLYYGQNYGVSIDSEQQVGTCVTITLPIIKEDLDYA